MSELMALLSDGSGNPTPPLHIDHRLVLSLSELPTPWLEDLLRPALESVVRGTRQATRVLTVVGYAAAAYLVMAGVARLVEASRKRRGIAGGASEEEGVLERGRG